MSFGVRAKSPALASRPRPVRKKLEDMTPAEILAREKAKAKRQIHESKFAMQIQSGNLPVAIREYPFAALSVGWDRDGDPKENAKLGSLRNLLLKAGLRNWAFDFAWPKHKIAFEIEGAPGRGRHTTAAGFKEDCYKYNEAQMMGWLVYRVTGSMVSSGEALNLAYRVFRAAGWRGSWADRKVPMDTEKEAGAAKALRSAGLIAEEAPF